MITITLEVQGDTVMRVSSEGHADVGRSGENIVCAAVSVLVRTFARSVDADGEVESTGAADGPGSLDIRIHRFPETKRQWLEGLSGFLLKGLNDIHEEYPGEVSVYIEQE